MKRKFLLIIASIVFFTCATYAQTTVSIADVQAPENTEVLVPIVADAPLTGVGSLTFDITGTKVNPRIYRNKGIIIKISSQFFLKNFITFFKISFYGFQLVFKFLSIPIQGLFNVLPFNYDLPKG